MGSSSSRSDSSTPTPLCGNDLLSERYDGARHSCTAVPLIFRHEQLTKTRRSQRIPTEIRSTADGRHPLAGWKTGVKAAVEAGTIGVGAATALGDTTPIALPKSLVAAAAAALTVARRTGLETAAAVARVGVGVDAGPAAGQPGARTAIAPTEASIDAGVIAAVGNHRALRIGAALVGGQAGAVAAGVAATVGIAAALPRWDTDAVAPPLTETGIGRRWGGRRWSGRRGG